MLVVVYQRFGTACRYLLEGLSSPNMMPHSRLFHYIVGGVGSDWFSKSGGASHVARA